MVDLDLGADSNLEFAGMIGLLVLLIIFLLLILVRGLRTLKAIHHNRDGLDTIARAAMRSKATSYVVVSGFLVVALTVVALIRFPTQGFTHLSYNETEIHLTYRFHQQPVVVPWSSVSGIRLVRRQHWRRPGRKWCYLEVGKGSRVYSSIVASSRDDRQLLEEAATKLVAARKRFD